MRDREEEEDDDDDDVGDMGNDNKHEKDDDEGNSSLMTGRAPLDGPAAFAEVFEQTSIWKSNQLPTSPPLSSARILIHEYSLPWHREMALLFQRAFILLRKSVSVTIMRLFMTIVMGVVIGTVFVQFDKSRPEQSQTTLGLLFTVSLFQGKG